VELFHVIGAADADIARPVQAEALLYGLLGGAIGAAAALVTVTAVGTALEPAAWGAAGFADWRLWGVAITATLSVGLAAAGGARLAVLRQLSRMP
jgi:ABC-type antimicrobial peptide transport system permease subunit